MELELVTVGAELLLGLTVDTNAAFIARALAPVGARVVRKTTVADDRGAIRAAVGDALGRTRFVIATGGLGPTRDDVTKTAVAELFDAPLTLDPQLLAALERRFAAFRRGPMPESNRSQAEVPLGAQLLPNRLGTAPGLWLEGTPGVAVLLPGVPHEMRALIAEQVVSRVAERIGPSDAAVRWRILRTTGIAESALASAIGQLERDLAPVTLAYLPGFEGVDLRLTVWGLPAAAADTALARAAARLAPVLAEHCYGESEDDLAALVLERLRARNLKLAVAESCTGGLVGARITAIPGASDVFVGGIVAYADEAKLQQLDVATELLSAHGAVSEPVAQAMARGAARRFAVDTAVAVTGIAGPSGGSPDKPVGTVCLGATLQGVTRTARARVPGDRDEVRKRSAQAALNLLRRLLNRETGGRPGV